MEASMVERVSAAIWLKLASAEKDVRAGELTPEELREVAARPRAKSAGGAMTIKVVAENGPADIARAKARDALRWPLRELAANLMRIVRGAGKPHEVVTQAADLITVFRAYYEATGHFPSSYEIANAILAGGSGGTGA